MPAGSARSPASSASVWPVLPVCPHRRARLSSPTPSRRSVRPRSLGCGPGEGAVPLRAASRSPCRASVEQPPHRPLPVGRQPIQECESDMNQTLSRRLHPLSRDAGEGEHATGQYRGMLMRALALVARSIGGLATARERALASPGGLSRRGDRRRAHASPGGRLTRRRSACA